MNKRAKEVMENYKIILSFLQQSKAILQIKTVIFWKVLAMRSILY